MPRYEDLLDSLRSARHEPKRFFSFRTDEEIQRFASALFDILDFHRVQTDDGYGFQSLTLRKAIAPPAAIEATRPARLQWSSAAAARTSRRGWPAAGPNRSGWTCLGPAVGHRSPPAG